MDLIDPPMEATLVDDSTGREMQGHLVASKIYPFKITNKNGDRCFAKQFKFQPTDGRQAFWIGPFPLACVYRRINQEIEICE